MDYVIVFALGMIAATMLIRWMAYTAIAKVIKQLEEESRPLLESQLRVKLEFNQNIYFLYNSDDGSFVAQGADFAELKQNLRIRFPNRIVTVTSGDDTALEKLKQQISDLDTTSQDKKTA